MPRSDGGQGRGIMKHQDLIALLAAFGLLGQAAFTIFKRMADRAYVHFHFWEMGFRGLLSATAFWIGAASIEQDEWLTGDAFLAAGAVLIIWALYRPDKPHRCSFCGQIYKLKDYRKFFARGRAVICVDCIDRARSALARSRGPVSTAIATIQYVDDDNRRVWCSFCGRRRFKVDAMAAAVRFDGNGAGPASSPAAVRGETRICDRCLDRFEHISAIWRERERERAGVGSGRT